MQTSRRSFLHNAALLAAAPLASAFTSPAADFTIADTRDGKVRGVSINGIKTFKGIPYGASTAGKNRWMPPARPAKWSGVRDALQWGHIAPQPFPAGRIDYVRLIEWMDQPGGQGEDCLVLNVWTPALKSGKRPVMVSFHGGGFTSGSSSAPGYNGEPLARFGDVVVVTINHRLGCLGYLHLADLDAPPQFSKAGTVGMLDCVAALEWVRDNIEYFGGDPRNVMIFGQSGGGAKVSTLLCMPAAKGLFHRAAIQSGSALRLTSRAAATKSAERMAAQIGLDHSRVAELRDVPFEMLISAQETLGAQTPPAGFAPVVDGAVIPRNPFDPDAPEISADVPLIVSTTLDDAALGRTDFSLDETGLRQQVRAVAGDRADTIIAAYRGAYPKTTPFLLLCRMLTDRGGRNNAITLAERKAAQNRAPVFMYLFSWPSPGYGGKFGAVHGLDVGLVFHNPKGPIYGDSPVAHTLADKMAAAWVAFAKTGNPNTPALPDWPAYNTGTRATMMFDSTCRVENDPGGQLRKFWDDSRA